MTEPWIDQLDLLIRSRTPILWIRSSEEERIQALLTTAAERLGQRLLLRWYFVQGLQGLPNRQGEAARNPMAALDSIESLQADQPAILLLLDFNRYCDDPGISRRLRNLATSLRRQPRTLVITAPDWQLPRELEECVTVLELPLPSPTEISQLLTNIGQASGRPPEPALLEQLAHCCSGLTEQRIRQVAARALARRGQLGEADLTEVL